VVGKGGSLVGYALGLDLKRRLLVIEGAIPQELLLE
jgi:methylated-DNA-[protein]-cysteine S-methyltransferase